jgi:hypothetical protein
MHLVLLKLGVVSQWDLQVSLELLQHYERQVVSELVAQVQRVRLELQELAELAQVQQVQQVRLELQELAELELAQEFPA